PYGAHTTASDALWVGLPVVTLAGATFASRVGASLLSAIGLPELVTHSIEQYEALVVELAQNPARILELKERLTNNRLTAPLFDSETFTRHIEAAYECMWKAYTDGSAPISFDVKSNRTLS
ncbi:MAG: tetratricopeptide repeat protein, partial [Burkholderiales bacterium]